MENRQPVADKTQDDLAESRRLKKRELDRKAQRLARERTKNRIAELESMVAHLQKNDTNSQTMTLLDQLSRVTKERDKVVATLRSLGSIIERQVTDAPANKSSLDERREEAPELPTPESLVDPLNSSSSASCSATPGGPELDLVSWSLQPWATNSPLSQDTLDCLSGMLPSDTTIITPDEGSSSQLRVDTILPLPADCHHPQDLSHDPNAPRPPPTCYCSMSDGAEGPAPPNMWRTANEALGKATRMTQIELMTEDFSSHDTPVRAIIEGWDSVEQAGKMTKAWRKLKKVDETCFKGCGPVERLACLKLMHLMMVYHGDPNAARQSELPRWFVQRPSQALFHSHAIDYFVWYVLEHVCHRAAELTQAPRPGIRERFIFGEHRYCTNIFWDLFQTNFKIRWPFGFRDTYMHNSETGQFQLSPVFQERLQDLNAWTMGPDFFAPFPELCGDIPTSISVPKTLTSMDEQLAMYLQKQNQAAARRAAEFGRLSPQV